MLRSGCEQPFDGGRGASDTFYNVLIQQPGLYPVRSVWFEGGGGANLEWYTRKADGTYANGQVIIRDGVLVVPKYAILPAGTVV